MEREVAKLFLSSGYLTTTPSDLGVRNATNTSFTWNVDMRNVLGETLWTKYNNFKVFIQIQQNSTANELITFFCQGLNFIQSSNQGQLQTNKIPIGSVSNNANAPGTKPVINGFIMIKPNANLVPLTITAEANDGTTTTLSQYLGVIFTFVPLTKNMIISPYNTCFQNEQRNFTLSTQILTAGGTNEYGTMNASKTIFTFNNVNMRQIIGTLWDKYDKFNLQIRTIGMAVLTASQSGNQRRQYFNISGLQFINNMVIENTTNLNNVWSPIFYAQPINYGFSEKFDEPTNIYTFRKPESENVSLSFTLWTLNNNSTPYTSIQQNDWSFTFSVFGVK